MPKVSSNPHPEADEGWARVATRLRSEFQQRGLSNAQVARDVQMAPATLQKLLEGGGIARADRAAALSIYLGWPGDGIERIRQGLEPDPRALPPPPVSPALQDLGDEDPDAYALLVDLAGTILDRARSGDISVLDAIDRDPDLTDAARRHLRNAYASVARAPE